jgi:hypothetical protein
MRMTDTDAVSVKEAVRYWVLVELRTATAQARSQTLRVSERYIAADARRLRP